MRRASNRPASVVRHSHLHHGIARRHYARRARRHAPVVANAPARRRPRRGSPSGRSRSDERERSHSQQPSPRNALDRDLPTWPAARHAQPWGAFAVASVPDRFRLREPSPRSDDCAMVTKIETFIDSSWCGQRLRTMVRHPVTRQSVGVRGRGHVALEPRRVGRHRCCMRGHDSRLLGDPHGGRHLDDCEVHPFPSTAGSRRRLAPEVA